MKHSSSISDMDTDYYNDNQKKFDHVSCKYNGTGCKSTLSAINHNYTEFYYYHGIKNYSQSINKLKNAFYKTSELKKPSCKNCAEYFRSVILNSLEDTRDELKKMSTGIFRTKRYYSSYIEVENTLMEFKNAVHVNSIQINNRKEHSFKTYAQKNVV